MQEYNVTVDHAGNRFWRQNGDLHRLDGPAAEYVNGTKYWYQNNRLHRTDGPAIVYADGEKSWYIEGKEMTEAEFLKRTQPAKELTVEEISKLLGYDVKVVGG